AWFNDGSIEVWDRVGTSRLLRLAGTLAAPAQMDFHPDGRTLALAEPGKGVRFATLDSEPGNVPASMLAAGVTNVVALHFDPSGSRLAIIGSRTAEVWDCNVRRLLWSINVVGSRGSGIWSPDGNQLAVIDEASGEVLILASDDGAVLT